MELGNRLSQDVDVKPSNGVLGNGGLGEEILACGWESVDRKVTFETLRE